MSILPAFASAAPPVRYLRAQVEEDLRSKMAFIGGPRQVGKTSLARSLLVAELGSHADAVPALLALGGYPEPFLSGSERFARRWSLGYRERLVREELASLEQVSDLGRLELWAGALLDRVGSPLSLNALREDLQVSHQTVARWTDMLERVYGIFRIAPFGAPKLRAMKKERKHYHYDWSVVTNPGALREHDCCPPAEMVRVPG
jgi:predicted AAA+ superfamily ATPase